MKKKILFIADGIALAHTPFIKPTVKKWHLKSNNMTVNYFSRKLLKNFPIDFEL